MKLHIRFESHPYAFKEWCIYFCGKYLCKEATLEAAIARAHRIWWHYKEQT